MAHKKGLGSSRNGRDSNAQRLGIGKDDTIFAKRDGTLSFRQSGERRTVTVVAASSSSPE
jgi:large subunit ribosomal protein L27